MMPVGADGFRLPSINNGETVNKLEVLSGAGQDELCRTFVINEEDHTLGNALKHIIMQNPAVELCGYTVPHPMERKIHVRVQTTEVPAVQVLYQALKDLKAQNENIRTRLKEEVARYQEDHPPDTDAAQAQ